MYECVDGWMDWMDGLDGWMDRCMYVRLCMYACMHVWMYVYMYVCDVCMYVM